MFARLCTLLAVAGISICFTSCTSEDRSAGISKLPTYPVSGQVYLNGEPAKGAAVILHLQNPTEQKPGAPSHPQEVTGKVDEQGNVQFRTYELNDGVPAGEYAVTFVMKERRPYGTFGNPESAANVNPDKLGGKYSDPDTSEHTLTVAEGGANDLGRIDLEADLAAVEAEQEAEQPQIPVP